MENKKKIIISNRKSTFASLEDFCSFSMGERKNKGDFIEVTEWSNGEGYDVHISDMDGDKRFSLTWGQYEAMKKCFKKLTKL